MNARDRRRVLAALAVLSALLFLGGALSYLVDFRHRTVCPGGRPWIARSEDDLGEISYLCPDGQTVTQGMLP